MRRPAVLGSTPAFPQGLPFARPSTPPLERVVARLRPSYERGALTNGPVVRALEEAVADRLGVRHVVAVSSCTSGLMLVLRHLADGAPTVLPSFTFSASAHAIAWTGGRPVFAECDPATFQLDVASARARLAPGGAVLATHVFGAPCPAEEIESLAGAIGAPVVFDAAHALGARRRGRAIGGFGDAEVFSLSPTKVVVAGEGGLVSTDHDAVAEAVRLGRDYGNPGDYDTRFVGLNARMSELHAALALESLADIDENLARRGDIARRYREGLEGVPGVACQLVDEGDESTYKDFTVAIGPELFGLTRDNVARALKHEGIDTRAYFWPPVHRQQAYAHGEPVVLPVTDDVAGRVLSLPMFPDLSLTDVDCVVDVIGAMTAHAPEIIERSPD